MCQPRVDRSVGSPSLEDSDIRIEKKWNWKEKRQEELIQHLGEVMTFDSTDNEQLLIEEEYYRQIFTVLNSLSDQRRVIVEMTMKGMRNEEIAQSLHVSVNTVKTLKKKAYVYLRENLSREGWMFLFTFL